jgi:hypothetical protein
MLRTVYEITDHRNRECENGMSMQLAQGLV